MMANQNKKACFVPDIFDDPFHEIALVAFVEVAQSVGWWPDSEEVRKLAYKRYEELCRANNVNSTPLDIAGDTLKK